MNRADRSDAHSSMVCPKTGKPIRSRQISQWTSWLYPLAGMIALIGFLMCVMPKPGGAAYPHQHIAAPLASSFVLLLLGIGGCALAFRHARQTLRKARFALGSMLFVLGIGAAVFAVVGGLNGIAGAIANDPTPQWVPIDGPNSPVGVGKGIHPGRVAWVYNPAATNGEVTWNNANGYYWDDNHCIQSEVNVMVPKAVRYLTGEQSEVAAWDDIFHYFNRNHNKGNIGYQPGEKIAIKLDLSASIDSSSSLIQSNAPGGAANDQGYKMINPDSSASLAMYQYTTNESDVTPQMAIALLHQMVDVAGVPQEDIYIGDPTHYFLDKLYTRCHAVYPNVHYIDCFGKAGRELATYTHTPVLFYSTHPTEIINGTAAPGKIMSDQIADFVYNADYFINLAALKRVESLGSSICAANTLGTMNRTATHLDDMLHGAGGWGTGWGSYNALVDHMGNKYLGGKTLLYMVDGLFGGWWSSGQNSMPEKWHSMNDWWPSSLFVSQDPVAIDSVGLDFLHMETNQIANCVDNYLHEAAQANNPPSQTFYDPNNPTSTTRLQSLGVHEHCLDPLHQQYSINLGMSNGIELVSVQPSMLQLGSQTAQNGGSGTISIPVTLQAQGTENALGFSINFDPSRLTLVNLSKDMRSGLLQSMNAAFNVNSTNLANGQLGIVLALQGGQVFNPGSQLLTTLCFSVKPVQEYTLTSVTVGTLPVRPEAVDANAVEIPFGWQPATVTIPYGYEADVTPFPHGKNNRTVTVTDWVKIGRFVAGLDTFTDANNVFQYGEFQRADCAPRGTGGDGRISMADWVQAGRYAAGLDLVVPASGPIAPANASSSAGVAGRSASLLSSSAPHLLAVQNTTLRAGAAGTVDVAVTARGDESAIGFTLNFDPKVLRFSSARLGSSTSKAVLNVNASQAAQGRVGIAFAMPLPKSLLAGKQTVLTLSFAPVALNSCNTTLTFSDQIITREMVSANAVDLSASYNGGTIMIVGKR